MKKVSLKAVVAMLILTTIISSIICGCGNTESSKGAPDSTELTEGTAKVPTENEKIGDDEVIELHVLTNWTSTSLLTEPMNQLIEEWNATGKYKITYEGLPSSDARTKISVSMAAGNPPDVCWCTYSYALEYAKQGLLMDWREVYENPEYKEFKQYFSEKVLNSPVDTEGNIILCPHEAAIDGLFCNMEVFNKYGWELPETWEDLIEIAKKCKEEGIAALVTGGADLRFSWLGSILMGRCCGVENSLELASGDAMTSWDDPQYGFVEAMTKFQELVDAGGFADGVLGISMSEADQMFARGEAAMYYEGAWKCADFAKVGGEEFIEHVQRIDFPTMSNQANGSNTMHTGGIGSGFFIPSNLSEEKKKAAIEFVLAFNNPDFNIPVMEQGGFIWAGNAEYDKSRVSDLMNSMIEAYRNSDSFLVSTDSFTVPEVDLAIKQTAMPGIVSGEMTVDEAVKAVNDAAKQYIDKNK